MRVARPVVVTEQTRCRLEQQARGRTTAARVVLRSRIVLLASEGLQNKQIAKTLQVAPRMVTLWRGRFQEFGIAGLPSGQKPDFSEVDFRPHPATWFDSERYLDDPDEWKQSNGGRDRSDGLRYEDECQSPAPQDPAAELGYVNRYASTSAMPEAASGPTIEGELDEMPVPALPAPFCEPESAATALTEQPVV